MNNLEFDIVRLLRRLRQNSYATRDDRKHILFLAARQLEQGGFKHLRATSLQEKHVHYLVERWKSQGLASGTIKNRAAVLRWWADAVGRNGLIPAGNAELGIAPRQYVGTVNKAKTLDAAKLEKITDPYVRLSLELQAAFGLRREESIKIVPSLAFQGGVLRLRPSWCKGGRAREILPHTEERLARFAEVIRKAGRGSLIPAGRDYIQQRNIYDAQTKAAGLSNMHGLRHQYAQERYEEITGWQSPKAGGPSRRSLTTEEREIDREARLTISGELGHSRIGIVAVYIG